MATNPIRAGREPVYDVAEFSPALPDGGFGLALSVVPALSEAGKPTVALFTSCRTPGRYADIYGGRQRGALRIIAIDRERGSVFENSAEAGHVDPVSQAMDPDPKPDGPGNATVSSSEFYFSVDLKAHLGLPDFAARYAVFLWLDQMTSAVLPVEMPGPAGPAVTSKVQKTPLERVPSEPEDLGVALPALRRCDAKARGVIAGGSGPFLLLGLDYRSRQMRTLRGNAAGPSGTGFEAFEFDPAGIFAGAGWLDAPDPPRKGFELLYSQAAISEVLVVEPV